MFINAFSNIARSIPNIKVSVETITSPKAGISDVVLVALITGLLACLPTIWNAVRQRRHEKEKMLFQKRYDAIVKYWTIASGLFSNHQAPAANLPHENLGIASSILALYVEEKTRSCMTDYYSALTDAFGKRDALSLVTEKTDEESKEALEGAYKTAVIKLTKAHSALQAALQTEANKL